MRLPGDQIVYRMDQREATRVLRQLRRRGLRSPRELLIAEGLRVALACVPFALVLLDVIRLEIALAVLIGYILARVFDKGIMPRLLTRLGPNRLRDRRLDDVAVVTLDPSGVRIMADAMDNFLGWSRVELTRVGPGFVLRIGHQMSIVFADAWIPDGWSVEQVRQALTDWSGQEVA